jgi:hypothetical protein
MMEQELVKAPTMEPFSPKPKCAACSTTSGGLKSLRIRLVHGVRFSTFDVSYCPGGKQPTEVHTNRNPLAGLFGADESREVLNLCAGIDEPHLHLRCRMCTYSWTMRCAAL